MLASLLVAGGSHPAAADEPDYAWSQVFVTQPPAAMHPGQKLAVTVVLRNEGTETWYGDGIDTDTPFRLAAVAPRDRSSAFASDDPTWLWSGGTRIRMATPVVGPGQDGLFSFTYTAPALETYPQTFQERFAPRVEGVAWLDEQTIGFTTTVNPILGAPAIPSPGLPAPPVSPPGLPPPPPPPAPPGVEIPACLPSLAGADELPVTAGDLLPPGAAAGYAFGVPHLDGQLDGPAGIGVDSLGKLLVADTGADRLLRVDPDTGAILFAWGASGSGPGELQGPTGIAGSATGFVFVADTGNDRIQAFSLGGVAVATFGEGILSGPRGVALPATGALAGRVVVADTGNDRIAILAPDGSLEATIGEPPGEPDGNGDEPGLPGDDPGDPAALSAPAGVAVFGDRIYVADTGNNRIQVYTADGALVGSWGGGGSSAGCFSAPTGIAATRYGVYVADTGNDRIQHFTRSGLLIDTWGRTGSEGGAMLAPAAITLGTATVWVAERDGNRIQRFAPRASAAPPTP